jgi:hypothetical protein
MSKPIEITAGKIETRTSNIAYSDGKFHNVEILWDSPPPTLVKLTSIPLSDSGASPATTVIIALSRLEDLVEKGKVHMIDIDDGLEEATATQTVPQPAPTVPRQFAGSPVEPFFRDGSVFLGVDYEKRRIRHRGLAKRVATLVAAKEWAAKRALVTPEAVVAAVGTRSGHGARGGEALVEPAGRVSDLGSHPVARSQTFKEGATAEHSVDGRRGPAGTDLSVAPESSDAAPFPESRRTERDRRDAGFWRARSRSAPS